MLAYSTVHYTVTRVASTCPSDTVTYGSDTSSPPPILFRVARLDQCGSDISEAATTRTCSSEQATSATIREQKHRV